MSSQFMMEGSFLCLVTAFLVCFPTPSQSQLYSMVLPSVLWVDTDEQIVVEAHGLNAVTEVTITIRDFPRKTNILSEPTRATMNPGNGMMVTPLIRVPAKYLKKDSKKNQYVVVQADCSYFKLEKVVLVSFQIGYIFTQTDKTIYTPGSSVRYRVFTMGHGLEPLDKNVIVEFETPTGVIVSRNTFKSASVVTQSYNLPETVSLGTWNIVTKYQDSPQETFRTPFDVKEYVLPSFEVDIEPAEKFYYIDTNRNFDVVITARYLFGKTVEGVAFVLFGVKSDDEKKSIPDSLRRIPIQEGKGNAVLTKDMLQTRSRDVNELVGHSLYISVTVITESGSDMVVAERGGIRIVTSPYQILFTKTPKFFKPEMPYELMVFVTNPDGSPAARVPVVSEPIRAEANTQNDGTAKLVLNTPADTQELRITVKTNQERLPDERQATKTMVATAYQTQGGSGNYLHLGIPATELKAGDNLIVNFNIKSNTNLPLGSQFKYFTYIILGKGRIIKVGRLPRTSGQNLVTLSLPITPNLIPSFRIMAYYQVENSEIVADSVWVDVKDTCMGTLVVKGATEAQIHLPGSKMSIIVEGDAKARVGLVAVDKAVYVLNKNYKISQTKIWDTVEKSDIGCTAGSGRNNVGVFEDAGLALETSNKLSTKQRSEIKCSQVAKRRRRRSLQLLEFKTSKVAQYSAKELRKCCEDGMYDSPMGYSCEKRAEYIDDQNECKTAFLECCRFIREIRDQNQREKELHLARSDSEEVTPNWDGTSRTIFPESWLWNTTVLPDAPYDQEISFGNMTFHLVDSITTWEVLAVSISEKKGICVADPYEITVRKDFFIDLRLPFSAVRNEQVEIRAILYNYGDERIRVRVELIHNPAFCSASTAKKRYRQDVFIRGQSSTSVPFVMVPLELGSHDIEVKAAVWGMVVGDGVMKKLRVVPEGMQRSLTQFIDLEPSIKGKNGVQEELVEARHLDDIVPGTETETKISVQGDPVAHIVKESIDGSNLKHLIITPSGCGEQNMITMTPSVIATYYLDATDQWEKVGVNRRSEATKQIMQGYAQQLTYMKSDYSYAAWKDRPSSTWLTAYVVKVFALAYKFEPTISDKLVCGGVKWLILEKQRPDGIFIEDAPVIHGEMVGGYLGAEPEVSLTAFVLVALLESKSLCQKQVNALNSSIDKAADCLLKKYNTLKRPYTTALTAYALALAGRLKDDRVLMAASAGENQDRWEEHGAHTYNIEGTSYALLALLKMKKLEGIDVIVEWLTVQRYYGGTYGQTQATIMVFQALAQYEIDIPPFKDLNLRVSIKLPERQIPIDYSIDYEGALLSRTTETKLNDNFTVRASGQGKAKVTVETLYHAQMKADEAQCKKFTLNVSVELLELGQRELKGSLQMVKIKICTRYLGNVDATMSIIDVSMLTGFAPDINDLNRLSKGVDHVIAQYEVDYSERGNLIIYLDKVSHSDDECVYFRAHQFFEVGLIQPASVKVYSYYNLDEQCIQFYNLPKESYLLSKICHGDICRCAEESCSLLNNIKEDFSLLERAQLACKPGVDYVYKARLVRKEEENGYDNYFMHVLEKIKEGTDPNPEASPRKFISQMKCRETLNLQENKDYLIWGLTDDLWPAKKDFYYLISKDTWIERWPSDDECQDEEFEKLCNDIVKLTFSLKELGCQV